VSEPEVALEVSTDVAASGLHGARIGDSGIERSGSASDKPMMSILGSPARTIGPGARNDQRRAEAVEQAE